MRSIDYQADTPAAPDGERQLELRAALGRFATGVTVITTCDGAGRLEGLTANSFSSLSLDPPLVLWNLQRSARSLPRFASAEYFAVNVLGSSQQPLSHHFSRPARDKFEGIKYELGLGGCPVFPGSLAIIECRAERCIEAGDHVIFIGQVERFCEREGRPLIFSGGEYRELSPANAG